MNFKLEREYIRNIENYYNNNQIDKAIEYCEKILIELPDSFNIKFYYAKLLKEVGKFEEAGIQFSNLELRYPENINLLLEIGELNFFLKNYEKSKEYLEKLLFYDHFNQKAKVLLDKIDELKKEVEIDNNDKVENQAEYEIKIDDSENIDELSKNLNIEENIREVVTDSKNDETHDTDDNKKDNMIQMDKQIDVIEEKIEENVFNELNSSISNESNKEINIEQNEKEENIEEHITNVKKVDNEDKENIESEFLTESAAELYFKQKLYDNAMEIYNKLYENSNDNKYLELIEKIKRIKFNEMLIENLNKFLEEIKKRETSV